jgi:hypothetical protein
MPQMAKPQVYRIAQTGDSLVGGGRLVLYHQSQQRYEIQYDGSRSFLMRQEFELEQLTSSSTLHILLASHVQSERDLVLLLRGVQSVQEQTDPDFCVFLSISGSASLVPTATDALKAMLCQQHTGLWFILPQESPHIFQHLQQLHELSVQVNANAWILFLKQTDLFHPQRVDAFRLVLQHPMTSPDMPFALSAKLLVGQLASTGKGQLRDFIHNSSDFHKWQSQPILKREVSLPKDQLPHEYFDYCIPSSLLGRFLRTTPSSLLSNPYCELRLASMLDDLATLEPLAPYPWLLIHYVCASTSLESTFNRHDLITGSKILDDPSVTVDLTDFDRHISETKFRSLSATQIALCRHHFESIIVRYCYWNEAALEDCEIRVIRQVDMYHGRGLGKLVWKHCSDTVRSCFSVEEQKLNQSWSTDDDNAFGLGDDTMMMTHGGIILRPLLLLFRWISSWLD